MSKKNNTNPRAFAWAKRLRDSKLRDSTGRTREIQAEIFHLSHLIECQVLWRFTSWRFFGPLQTHLPKPSQNCCWEEVTPTNAFTLQNLWNLKTSSPPETGFPRHPRKIPIDLRFSPRCCQVFHKSVKISSQKLKRAADSLRENVVDMENVFHLGILPNIYRVFFHAQVIAGFLKHQEYVIPLGPGGSTTKGSTFRFGLLGFMYAHGKSLWWPELKGEVTSS